MKIVVYLLCLILVVGCAGDGTKTVVDSDTVAKIEPQKENVKISDVGFKPYKLVDDYMVTDTGYFDFGLGDGVYAVVKRNNELIDTINKSYGFQQVDNMSYMYNVVVGNGPLQKGMSQDNRYNKSMSANFGDYVIITATKKTNVSTLAPDFGWFANPVILNHKIYYWQVKETGESTPYKIFAAEFDPITKITKITTYSTTL